MAASSIPDWDEPLRKETLMTTAIGNRELDLVIEAFHQLLAAWEADRHLRPMTPIGDEVAFEARQQLSRAMGAMQSRIESLEEARENDDAENLHPSCRGRVSCSSRAGSSTGPMR